jgi:hypothetical protein
VQRRADRKGKAGMKMQMPQGILWRATLQRKNEKGEVL